MTYEPGTALEFFAGIGLARMGLERAGWRVAFSNDIDPKKYEMYAGHWGEDPKYVTRSVFSLNASELPSAELAWASFPCIDLSLAGNRAGLRGQSSSAYWGFHRLLADMSERRPPLVVIENVPGMLTSHGGNDLEMIVSGLNDLGYRVDALALDAASFVPQSRLRIFLVGVREPYRISEGIPEEPTDLHPPAVLRFIRSRPNLGWGRVSEAVPPRRKSSLTAVVEQFPPDADIWWTAEATEKLVRQMSDRNRLKLEKLRDLPITSFVTVYRRVRPSGYMAEPRFDGLAGCLRTARGGSSKQFVVEVGRGAIRVRNMTSREYARLQGAPDFHIRVPYIQALCGFGDAVCVPAVSWLLQYCVEPIRAGVLVAHQAELVLA